jgi:molybdopterin-guanine dinucleotide biosynthesis protein A
MPHRPPPPAPAAVPRGVVLLAAGSGQRMRPLTEHCPKALLPVGDSTVIDLIIDAVKARTQGEIVVVTGFAAEELHTHLAIRHGARVRSAHNPRWAEDVNINSVATGVAALDHPERGYLVVETDLLLDDTAWDRLFGTLAHSDDSFWVCRGRYSPALTGGVVHAGADGRIDVVDYRPVHDPACDGWPKMLGLLAVGPKEVATDRALREAAIRETLRQYYLMPWKHGIAQLPARVLALEDGFAATFNTPDDFRAACRAFQACAATPA